MNKNQLVKTSLASILTLAAVGLAVWIGGLVITANVTGITGSQPMALECSGAMNFNSSDNQTIQCSYDNPDGQVELSFLVTADSLYSTNGACNYEADEDVVFYVCDGSTENDCQHVTATQTGNLTITSGSNEIVLKGTPSENRCPLAGSVVVTGTIV